MTENSRGAIPDSRYHWIHGSCDHIRTVSITVTCFPPRWRRGAPQAGSPHKV